MNPPSAPCRAARQNSSPRLNSTAGGSHRCSCFAWQHASIIIITVVLRDESRVCERSHVFLRPGCGRCLSCLEQLHLLRRDAGNFCHVRCVSGLWWRPCKLIRLAQLQILLPPTWPVCLSGTWGESTSRHHHPSRQRPRGRTLLVSSLDFPSDVPPRSILDKPVRR